MVTLGFSFVGECFFFLGFFLFDDYDVVWFSVVYVVTKWCLKLVLFLVLRWT